MRFLQRYNERTAERADSCISRGRAWGSVPNAGGEMSHDALQLAGDLRATLSGVRFPVTRSAAIELRKCVSEYAAAMKSAGVPPEDAVVAVKDVLQEAGFEPTTHSESTKAA